MKKTRIMYIEAKPEVLGGPARIGRVTFSNSGRSLYYRDRQFQSLGATAKPAKSTGFPAVNGAGATASMAG